YNPVLTKKQGEVSLSANGLVALNIVGANASITGAITDNLALQANISATSSHVPNLNFNASYLLNPGSKFEVRPLLGYKSSLIDYYYYPLNSDIDVISWNGNLKIPYAGMQVAGNQYEKSFGIALKVGSMHPHLYKGTDFTNGDDEFDRITELNLLIEPSFFVSHKISKRLKCNASLTMSFLAPLEEGQVSNEVDFSYLKSPMGNIGISYDIVSKSK
ncbi:MAG: hypothetical protein WBA74_25705, partial [Cyclobacteriaceae bacterium]